MAPSCAAGNDVNNYNGSFVDVRPRPHALCVRPGDAARPRAHAHQHTHIYIYILLRVRTSGRWLASNSAWRSLRGCRRDGLYSALAVRLAAGTSRFELRAGELRNFRDGTETSVNFRKLPERNRNFRNGTRNFRTAARVPKARQASPVPLAWLLWPESADGMQGARRCERARARAPERRGCREGAPFSAAKHMRTHARPMAHIHICTHTHTHMSHACDACAAVHPRVRRAADERRRVGALSG
jgi:hypothetical protein